MVSLSALSVGKYSEALELSAVTAATFAKPEPFQTAR
jgi:hypothetical protein